MIFPTVNLFLRLLLTLVPEMTFKATLGADFVIFIFGTIFGVMLLKVITFHAALHGDIYFLPDLIWRYADIKSKKSNLGAFASQTRLAEGDLNC